MMIDSHCHLNFKNLSDDFDNIIKRADENKITSILSINTDPKDFDDHYNLIKKYKSIFLSYGLHPANVNSKNIKSLENIKYNTNNNRVIGLGETGLDFYHSKQNIKEQYISFEKHIECSFETNLPLIIHQRNSENEIIDVLKSYQKNKPLNLVFHCFTGSNNLKKFCLDNNYYISLSGIVTFKNAQNLRDIIVDIPLKNLLIETDSPFLSPEPFRGKINEPSHVKFTATYLSNLFNISFEKIIKETDNNFYNLFSKAIRYKNLLQ